MRRALLFSILFMCATAAAGEPRSFLENLQQINRNTRDTAAKLDATNADLLALKQGIEEERFWLQTLAILSGFLAGGLTFRLVLLGKNQRHFLG